MEMFEKTFAMFAPFARGESKPTDKPEGSGSEMRTETPTHEMQKRLDSLRKGIVGYRRLPLYGYWRELQPPLFGTLQSSIKRCLNVGCARNLRRAR